MPRLSRCGLFTLLFVGGCAIAPAGSGGNGGNPQPAGGSPAGGTPASTGGAATNPGSSGGSIASTTAAPACTPDASNLVTGKTWICDMNTPADNPIQIQGSFYSYGDGASCTAVTPFCSATAGCCMTGTTVLDLTYAKWGCGMGMELNNPGGTGTKSVYSGPVKCFDITLAGSSGGNEVRIGFTQSTDTTNKVAPFTSVAAFSNGWTGRACFTAECPVWATATQCTKAVGTTGTPYDMQIQVSAGSTTTSVGAFNVCVTKIVPVIDPGSSGTTSSCSTVSGQGTLTGQYDAQHVACNGQDYIVQNNAWGSSAGQTVAYGPGTKLKVTMQNGTGVNTAPASYPSIFIGGNGGRSTTGNGLPKAVSSLGTVQTSWTWAANGVPTTSAYNAAYDVWFSSNGAAEPSATFPSGGYLMIWLFKPTQNSPIGSMISSATIGGKTWNVWYGTNSSNGKPCVSYVAQQNLNSLSFDLNLFIKDAVRLGYVQNGWGLTNVFAGFEIWSGGVGLETTDFAVTVN